MNEPVKLTEKLPLLADSEAFPDRGAPLIRWGQLLRTTPAAARLLEEAKKAGTLVPLSHLARVRSGVVTRANAFFIVQDLPLEAIPHRFKITRQDYKRTAVILDGKDTPHRINRTFLKKIIKGPDSLLGPTLVQETDLRLVSVDISQALLREKRDNDTLSYLRRGETVNYSVSLDKMKGGIPAERSNIRVRRPFWYSLNLPENLEGRLVVPEHFDQRFIATELSGDMIDRVVIDTCYVVECKDPAHQRFLLMTMNSLLTWYQMELRGRTQHGEGVLKVKIPDFEGIFVLDPTRFTDDQIATLSNTFEPLASRQTLVVTEELEKEDRSEFDRAYLHLAGLSKVKSETSRISIARELREAMSERRIRPESVAEMKIQSKPKQRAGQVIDALASTIVSKLDPYPDPRHYALPLDPLVSVPVPAFQGALKVGSGLFEGGTVLAGSEPLVVTPSQKEARFVLAVLTIDPALSVVDIPRQSIDRVVNSWENDVGAWCETFNRRYAMVCAQIVDARLSTAIKTRALEMAHASEVS